MSLLLNGLIIKGDRKTLHKDGKGWHTFGFRKGTLKDFCENEAWIYGEDYKESYGDTISVPWEYL